MSLWPNNCNGGISTEHALGIYYGSQSEKAKNFIMRADYSKKNKMYLNKKHFYVLWQRVPNKATEYDDVMEWTHFLRY